MTPRRVGVRCGTATARAFAVGERGWHHAIHDALPLPSVMTDVGGARLRDICRGHMTALLALGLSGTSPGDVPHTRRAASALVALPDFYGLLRQACVRNSPAHAHAARARRRLVQRRRLAAVGRSAAEVSGSARRRLRLA